MKLRAQLLPELYDTKSNYQLIVTITNKIREEYDSGINYLTGLYIQLLSYMPEKKSHSSATSASSMTRTVQLLRHDAYNCTITAEIRPADDQSDSRILI